MSPSGSRTPALDVCMVVDATMEEIHLELVRHLVTSIRIPEPARVAFILYGDHPELYRDHPKFAANDGDQIPSFDVRPEDFSVSLEAQRGWLAMNLTRVAVRYGDAALECALAAANSLTWRDEAEKLLLIVGWSLPHYSRPAELRLRTGVPCPRDECWLTQLEKLERRSHLTVLAATPADAQELARGFLGLLRRTVWERLAGKGRPPEVLDAGLAGRWSDLLSGSP